jgi:hypothetical protein
LQGFNGWIHSSEWRLSPFFCFIKVVYIKYAK